MAKLVSLEKISLKNHPEIKEDMIQQFIFDNPEVLGLGDLTPITREKVQPSGGRLDLLFGSSDNDARYEVEIQLGATDPSHIIRTIEYWDTEKKRYPQYDHCAVIVAEEITGRFMNVIGLFNGAIPLIALQLSAHNTSDGISLSFTKVIDRVTPGTDDEDEFQITDRAYWENRSTPKMLKNVDKIFEDLGDYVNGYSLKYNKFYIGIEKDGVAKNFVSFKPKKNYLRIVYKFEEDSEITDKLEKEGLDVSYASKWKQYQIKIDDFAEYENHKLILEECIIRARDYYNLSE